MKQKNRRIPNYNQNNAWEKYCEMAKNEKQLQFVHLCKGQTTHAMRLNAMPCNAIRYDTFRQLVRSFVRLFVRSYALKYNNRMHTDIYFHLKLSFFLLQLLLLPVFCSSLTPKHFQSFVFSQTHAYPVIYGRTTLIFFICYVQWLKNIENIETRVVFVLKRENVGGFI